MIILKNGRKELFQWDMGQSIVLLNEILPTEVHFQNINSTHALVVELVDNEAPIPNILLQEPFPIEIYLFYKNNNESHTIKRKTLTVIPRAQPDDYVYTPTDIFNWHTLEQSKQDKLTAGTGITIDTNNVISADSAVPPVLSVNGETGAVIVTTDMIGAEKKPIERALANEDEVAEYMDAQSEPGNYIITESENNFTYYFSVYNGVGDNLIQVYWSTEEGPATTYSRVGQKQHNPVGTTWIEQWTPMYDYWGAADSHANSANAHLALFGSKVSKAGDTMTGNLNITERLRPSLKLTPSQDGQSNKVVFEGSYIGEASFAAWEDSTGNNRRVLSVYTKGAQESLDNAVKLRVCDNGVWNTYDVYHSGMSDPLVHESREINGKPLEDDIILTAVDVGALPATKNGDTYELTGGISWDGEALATEDFVMAACEMSGNKVTSISADSTDTQYPSAKCVYEAIREAITGAVEGEY